MKLFIHSEDDIIRMEQVQPCQFIMEHVRLISIAQKVIHTFGKDRQLTLCYAVCSRERSITLRPGKSARSIRGRKLNKGAE